MDWKDAVRQLEQQGQVTISYSIYQKLLALDTLPDQIIIRRNKDDNINVEAQ